nr:MAG TPA: Nuclease [Caudoviricetes sp.]
MIEREIEEYLRLGVKKLGGIAFKFKSPGNAGVPDRLIVLPGNRIYFIELKRSGGEARPLQKMQINRLKGLGCKVFVIDSKERVDKFLDDIQST